MTASTEQTRARRVLTVARVIFSYLALLFVAGVVVQFFLAGVAVFGLQMQEASTTGTVLTNATFAESFGAHLALGDLLALGSLVLVAVALVARLERQAMLRVLGLFALVLVQATVAFVGPPAVRGLHPALGLAILAASVWVARDALRDRAPHVVRQR